MNRIFIRAPKIMRKVAMSTIWICYNKQLTLTMCFVSYKKLVREKSVYFKVSFLNCIIHV